MLRRAARKLVRAVRRFNRAWVDALEPAEEPAPPAPEPAPSAPARSTADQPSPARSAPGGSTSERPADAAPQRTVEVWSERTPNPDAMKFSASVPVAPRGALSFDDADAAASHPVGRAVFGVGRVRSMFAVNDFVTVTREPGADWAELAPRLEAAIAEALSQ